MNDEILLDGWSFKFWNGTTEEYDVEEGGFINLLEDSENYIIEMASHTYYIPKNSVMKYKHYTKISERL